MCEQTVNKQQQKQEQTDQARTLIKSKLSKQTVKRRDGNQMQLPASPYLLPTLCFTLSLSLSAHSLCRAYCALVCVSICKQTRRNSWLRSLALSRALSHTAHARVPHRISQTITPPCARRFLCGLWVDCRHLSLTPVLWMNSRLWVNFRFPFALFVFILAFALHLLPQVALSAHVPHIVVAGCCCCRLSNLKLNIDLNNILCVVTRRLVLLSSIFSSSS